MSAQRQSIRAAQRAVTSIPHSRHDGIFATTATTITPVTTAAEIAAAAASATPLLPLFSRAFRQRAISPSYALRSSVRCRAAG